MKLKFIVATLAVCFIFCSSNVKAQLPHFSLYAHGLYAAPLDGNSQARYKGGLGVVGGFTLGSKNTRGVLSVGYSDFFNKHNSPDHALGDETYTPVKLGIRQYLPLTLHMIFVQGDAGIGFVGYKSTANSNNRFAADIGAGVHFAAFEAALVWDSFKQPDYWSSWFTVQAGFTLGL